MIEGIAKKILAILVVSAILCIAYDYIILMVYKEDLNYTKAHAGQYISSISADENLLAMGIVAYPADDKIHEEYLKFFNGRFSDLAKEGLEIKNVSYSGAYTATSGKEYSYKTNGPIKEIKSRFYTIDQTGDGKADGVSISITYVLNFIFPIYDGDLDAPITVRGNYKLTGDI